ncbi:MAG: MFS family permease [Planctomycetota bacterium]
MLLGLMLLMLGNGMQGTLLGVRGAIEGFDSASMSYVMSAYFLGLLAGSRFAPRLIRRVGHVRVFAALASVISAAFILYAAVPNIVVWSLLRLVVGFCFSGVYVVVESWLNDSATNETRGKTLSLYMIVQMVGIIAAQGIMTLADPAGWALFAIISVLVSVSFAPILLSVSPAPVFETTSPMSLRELYRASPLGFVGQILLGAIFSGLFGMSAVFAAERGMSVQQISIFVASIYIGGLFSQYPIGWISDRMDRRALIMAVTALGAVCAAMGWAFGDALWTLYLSALLIGAVVNPLYSLLIAHTNDFLEPKDMAAASGGMLFLNGFGAIGGPIVVGYLMQRFGTSVFFGYMAVLLAAISLYALWRTTRRAAPSVEDQSAYAAVLPQASAVAVEVAQAYAIEQIEAAEAEAEAEAEAVAEAEAAAEAVRVATSAPDR